MVDNIAQLLANAVQWVVVPGIMIVLLLWGLSIPGRVSDSDNRRSAWAGFWAGLIVFVIYVVSQLSTIRSPSFNFDALPAFSMIPLIIGFASGFIFLWIIRAVGSTPLIGVITLLLSATSSIALFSYVFINNIRGVVLYVILGVALGILIHIVLFPKSVRES